MNAVYFSGVQQATAAQPCAAVSAANVCSSIATGGTNYATSATGGSWETVVEPVPSLAPPLLGVLAILLVMLAYRSFRRRA
jgi:hypothetical protein